MGDTATTTRTGRYTTLDGRDLRVGDYVHSGHRANYLRLEVFVGTTEVADWRGNTVGTNYRFECVNKAGRHSFYDVLGHYQVPAWTAR